MSTDAPGLLVQTQWLAAHLDDPGVRVLDCTTHLQPLPDNSYYTVRPGREEFLQGHVPGAAFVDMDRDVADTDSPLHFMLPSSNQFARAMSASGIADDTLVVSYSSANHWWAARMWWMLRVFGHEHAAVLDGGLQKWRAEGRPLESGPARVRVPGHFSARPARSAMLAAKEDVLAAIGSEQTCIVNALRPEQHAGTGGVFYGRRGHIQGSINVPAVDTVDANNVYRSDTELRRLFAAPLSAPRVIAYCGGGIAACADILVLTMLGHRDARLYDASLSEWARDASLPMQTGGDPRVQAISD